ncbi:MAG: ABC transporter permease [Euzebyales bacterium]|nr:ABC transporter permease [Euzebyales bacterium]
MGPRARYTVNEVGIGLRRNLLMTLATIVTLTVSLTLLGIGGITTLQVDKAKRVLYGEVEVSIFLTKGIATAQRDSMESDLLANPIVQQVIYESEQQAYLNAEEIFADDPELLQAIEPGDLPASFRVKLTDPEKFEVVASQFTDYPGVDEVVDQRAVLQDFFQLMNTLRNGALFVAALQLLGAIALVANTIRITAFARREQTGIMKLVGATNWYIRLPFMLEGIVAGLVGSLLAGGLLLLGDVTLYQRAKESVGFFPFLTTVEVATVIPLLVLIGVTVSAAASFLSLRRFLDV